MVDRNEEEGRGSSGPPPLPRVRFGHKKDCVGRGRVVLFASWSNGGSGGGDATLLYNLVSEILGLHITGHTAGVPLSGGSAI